MNNDIISNAWSDWEVVKQIGRGSYGTVYEAVKRIDNFESRAAVKVIYIPQNESEINSLRADGMSEDETYTYMKNVVNDFINEIQITESFKGIQNIVSIEDYKVIEKKNTVGWEIYIRMELLTPFNAYACDHSFTEQEVIKLGCDICTALDICSKRNVIHRDIKPENIFINSFGDFKLGDFGIARKLENVTGGLSQKGTYNYMAPEIERGEQYDATVDLYSLGLVMYRLLNSNRLPFLETRQQVMSPNERMNAVRRRMSGEPLPAPCNASEKMALIIKTACEYNPAKRFRTALDMKAALLDLLNNGNLSEPVNKQQSIYINTKAEPENMQSDDMDMTVSVRKPDITVKNKELKIEPKKLSDHKNIATFGTKKKSKLPKILAAIAVFAVVAGTGGYAVSRYNMYKSDIDSYSVQSFYKSDVYDENLMDVIPNAYYMKENNLSLEEYIEKLKKYTYNKKQSNEHKYIYNKHDLKTLKITYDNEKYEVYYWRYGNGAYDNIPVPKDMDYKISKTNDGYAVTVKVN